MVEIQIGPHKLPGIRAIAVESEGEAIIGRDVLNHLIVPGWHRGPDRNQLTQS